MSDHKRMRQPPRQWIRGLCGLTILLATTVYAGPPLRHSVPAWAADAVWYQVLVSRFHNGCSANDPPGVRPWTTDWAKLDPGEKPPLRDRLFSRAYGGDLTGLRDKLTYIHNRGANSLYLNPVFIAPSQHKYDTADFRHIDDTYGVAYSAARVAGETEDPATWGWSDSDRLFLEFLTEAHEHDIRVVLDGVFNHVGRSFWAWRDVVAHGANSPYAAWFEVTAWGPPMRWRGWDRPNGDLVCFRQVEDGLHPEVEAHLFAVVRRWMDPNGDGDPADGVDGWRLDAAEQVPHGFWRRFRHTVKTVNPDALIVGEIWTDAREWLGGDQFDVVTNYAFSSPVVRFFGQGGGGYEPSMLADDLAVVREAYTGDVTRAMWNHLGTHDTERAVSMLTDPQQHLDGAGRIPRRDVLVPDRESYARLRLAAFLQFTYPGAPLVYYGDEAGMYGGDDPFCRAPMWWRSDAPVHYRTGLRDFYGGLAELRRSREELRRGDFCLVMADNARRLLVFTRRYGEHESLVLINGDTLAHMVTITVAGVARRADWVATRLFSTHAGRERASIKPGPGGRLEAECPALSGQLLLIPGSDSR